MLRRAYHRLFGTNGLCTQLALFGATFVIPPRLFQGRSFCFYPPPSPFMATRHSSVGGGWGCMYPSSMNYTSPFRMILIFQSHASGSASPRRLRSAQKPSRPACQPILHATGTCQSALSKWSRPRRGSSSS